ncbi:MAG: type IV pilin N-terminal domain-containing protein [Methanoregula sp.]|nr:type IV pilin N-terminal domain-containing protein [Methanoregula sp.]
MQGKDAAVSPVVGVMLMLAITVMIAAIVSAAAGGLSGTEKKAPSAILDVTFYAAKDYGGYSMPSMTIKHISGNVLPTKDLQLITYYRTPSGTTVKGSLTGQVAIKGNDTCTTTFKADKFCGVLFINDENRFGSGMIQDSDKGYASWFGNASATLRPGDILATPAQLCGASCNNPSMEFLFPGVNLNSEFPVGSVVSVKIIHTPSGQIIYDKDVVIV